MPTYHEILTTDLSALTTAAERWDGMAKELNKQEDAYRRDVHDITLRPTFVGESQSAANARFGIRLTEFQSAQTEAKAIASLLRDAHTQFVDLRKKLESARDDAIAKGMKVSDQGVVSYDTGKLSQGDKQALAHDPDYQDSIRKDVASWQTRIDQCVQDVDDADKGVEVAFTAVVKGPDQGFGTVPDFNGKAQGDIEKYEADEARDIAQRVNSGDASAADYQELQRLFHDNSGDKAFGQTLLDELGAKGTLQLSNSLDGLAYHGDKQHSDQYLDIQKGLATTLATATQDPSSSFYKHFREDMQKAGTEQFKVDGLSPIPDEKVRGYQSLVTLMQQGNGYNGQFLEDTADDIRHAEESYTAQGHTESIWALRDKFSGKDRGWFANDPLDGVLGIMSHDPKTSAEYLDPAHTDNLDYLLHGRDWDTVIDHYATPPGGTTTGMPVMAADGDDRKGFGDALAAAATGIDPDGQRPMAPTPHTDANNRVFVHALDVLSKQGDDMPASLRDDMAKIMVNHGRETYVAMSDLSGGRHLADGPDLNRDQVLEMTKQISRSQDSYNMLHEGMNYAITADINDPSRHPEDTLHSAGTAIGFMEEGRYLALKGDQHDYTWDKTWSYHASGALLNFIPVYGDIAQRGTDALTTAWVMDEQRDQAAKLTSDSQATYHLRQNQLNEIARTWYAANPEWADSHTDYSHDQGIYDQINGAANNGNERARGMAGAQ
ncbi:hypothetical protein [Streptomyces sp. MMG1121]|uniref:hypothetical protein n=1 Tax=Streptomyces sp. MMG1121 TaxID=1415544 RepID=UPI0006AE6DFD|nr:hypothetical protein [Streptomyces sp. MMG1121]KOV62412.1 hypothetical protein ADK64_24040 [Streptomyces sp. MMG1121]